MEDKKGKAATRAKNKYNAKAYDRLYPITEKGKKEFYDRAAQSSGAESLNVFIISAIEEKMQRETPDIYNEMIK